jgi:transcriptional regulator with XRE-family HTH domain
MQELDLKAIGSRIKSIREELDLTQAEFAEAVGVNKKTISLVENGHRKPSQEILSIISHKYQTNLEWVSTGNGNKKSDKKVNPRSADNMYAKIISMEMELTQMKDIMQQILERLK